MSSHRHVMITPYLKIVVPKKKVPRTQIAKCCGRRPIGKFCPTCGTALTEETIQVTVDAVDQSEISQSLGESLCHLQSMTDLPDAGFDIWYPNKAGTVNTEEIGAQAITCDMIEEAKDHFTTSYADDLAAIVKAYGQERSKDGATVHFGVLIWWM